MATASIPVSQPSQAERIFALLDAARKLDIYHHTTLFAQHFEDGIAEYALRLWASANGLKIVETNNAYNGSTIRALEMNFSATDLMKGSVTLQWPAVEVPVEVREPVAGVVIPLPVALPPSAEPAVDLDDSARRFSLLEIE